MHDIWNPWHGCVKKSEGCKHCYMYYLDRQRGHDGSLIYRVKNNFDYPLHKNADGTYKIQSGEHIRVCLTSDFFLAEADNWRTDAWSIIAARPDVAFHLLTKRPERVAANLPRDWGNGWDNVMLSVTAENQTRADERIPILLDLPFKHKGIMTAPFIGPISIRQYLAHGQIEQVIAGGENYDGARVLKYDWVHDLYKECVAANVQFCFIETGTIFEKAGQVYNIPTKRRQSEQALKSGLQHNGRKIIWNLRRAQCDLFNDTTWYKPTFNSQCQLCAMRMICNGVAPDGMCG